jgi:hypothetical protein
MATCTTCSGVCSLWVEAADVDCPGNLEDYDTALGTAVQVASDWLYMATGRRFSGCCQTTVRPCHADPWADYDPRGTFREAADWHSGSGICACGGCGRWREVHLGLEPVRSIISVTVDGVTLDSSAYKVLDYSTLIRVDGDAWPCSNDLTLETTEDGTWSVEFTYGRSAPAMGVEAAKVLACEVVKAITDQGECTLPANVQRVVRLGVTQDFAEVAGDGPQGWLTGLWLPDKFINAYNPYGLAREADVFSPDLRRRARVVTG